MLAPTGLPLWSYWTGLVLHNGIFSMRGMQRAIFIFTTVRPSVRQKKKR